MKWRRLTPLEERLLQFPHIWAVYEQQLHARGIHTFTDGCHSDEPLVSSDEARQLQAWYDLSRS